MNTLEKLASYRSALERWNRKKNTRDEQIKQGKHPKEMEPEPSPASCEIGASDMFWAEKIRKEVIKPLVQAVNLDQQITKLPKRKV